MTYVVSAAEQEARDELNAAALAASDDPSPENMFRLREASDYMDALLEMLTPRVRVNGKRIPPVGIPSTPGDADLVIASLERQIAELSGNAIPDNRKMTRTAFDESWAYAPRSQDRRPPGRAGEMMHMPGRTPQYIPESDSSPAPGRIRAQAWSLRREANASRSRNSRRESR